MKDKPRLWRVTYETGFMTKAAVRWFASEVAARRFYKKTWGMKYFQSASIFHVIEDNVRLIVTRVTSPLMDRPEFQKLWKKLKKNEQKKILKNQEVAVRKVITEILTYSPA